MTAQPMNMQEAMAALLPSGARYERAIYYRTPLTQPNGRPHRQAGWIVTAGSNENTTVRMMRRGFEPLYEFGQLPSEPGPGGSWGPILRHPNGPAQFPLEQVKAYFWFRPENVPLPGVKFPCLRGAKFKEYGCPDCEHRKFLQTNHLARHLKNSHGYDRASLIALENKMGWSFTSDLTGSKIDMDFSFEDTDESSATEDEEPAFVLETETPPVTRGRRAAVPV